MRRGLAAVWVLAHVAAPAGADWPMLHGGPMRDAKSAETGLLKQWPAGGPPLAWKRSDLGAGHASPIVTGGKVIVLGGGRLEAVSIADGSTVWEAPCRGGATTPASDGESVFVQCGSHLAAFAADKGKRRWDVDLLRLIPPGEQVCATAKAGWCASPLVDEQNVYASVGHQDACVVALDKASGKVVWVGRCSAQAGRQGAASPLLVRRGGRRLILAATAFHMVCFSAEGGEPFWEYRVSRPGMYGIFSSPGYWDGLVFCVAGYHHAPSGRGSGGAWTTHRISENGRTAERAWNADALNPYQENVVCVDGLLFGSGRVCWQTVLDSPNLLVNGRRFAEVEDEWFVRPRVMDERARMRPIAVKPDAPLPNTRGGGLLCVEMKTGRILGVRFSESSRAFCGHMPVYADGRLYSIQNWSFRDVYLLEPTPEMAVRGRLPVPVPDEDREGGRRAWTYGFSSPALSDGRLILRYGRWLFAYDVRAPGPAAPREPE